MIGFAWLRLVAMFWWCCQAMAVKRNQDKNRERGGEAPTLMPAHPSACAGALTHTAGSWPTLSRLPIGFRNCSATYLDDRLATLKEALSFTRA